jgi:hypothetical protein
MVTTKTADIADIGTKPSQKYIHIETFIYQNTPDGRQNGRQHLN